MVTLKQPKTVLKKMATGVFKLQRDYYGPGELVDRATGKIAALISGDTFDQLESGGFICPTGRPSWMTTPKFRLTKKGLSKAL